MNKIAVFAAVIIEFSFYLLVLLVPLVFTTINFELFEFNKMIVVYILTTIIIVAWIGKSILEGKLTIRRTPLDFAILLFLASQVASTIVSIDRQTSIFGYYSRFNGGLLSTAAYIILFYAALANLNRQKLLHLLNLVIAAGVLVAAWGIPSHFDLDPSCKLIIGVWTSSCWSVDFQPTLRIFSTIGQPNWLAAYLSMLIPVSLVLVFLAKSIFLKFYYLFAAIILFWAFILTNSRAASFGMAVALLLMLMTALALSLKNKGLIARSKENFNWLFVAAVILSFGLIFALFGQQLIGRVKLAKSAIGSGQNQQVTTTAETALLSGGTESGQIRFIVWRGALEIFKHYPIFGSGVETFGYSYYRFRPQEHNQTTEWNFLYNKAHNEYLNYLANSGSFGLVSYLLLLSAIFYLFGKNLKSAGDFNLKLLNLGLIAGLLANLIQNFFGFSVVISSLLAFIYPAIMTDLGYDKPKWLVIKLPAIVTKQALVVPLVILILLTGFLLLDKIKNYWLADVAFAQAQGAETVDLAQALQKYQTAIALSPATEPLYYSNLGAAAADLALEQKETDRPNQYIEQAKSATLQALTINPVNLNYWRTATQTYLKLGLVDSTFINFALASAETATEIAPTEPEIHYQLALVQRVAGFPASASATLKKVLKLKPDYQKAINELENLKLKNK